MEEARDGNALSAQVTIGGRAHETSAETVDQNASRHASAMRLSQSVDELQSKGVGAEDVSGESDADFRPLNGGEHSRVGLVSAGEHRGYLAGRDALAGDLGDRNLETLDRIGERHATRLVGIDIPKRSLQSPRAALYATNPKAEIQERADDRREPRHSDPPDGGGDVALVDQCVNGDGDGDQDMDHRSNERSTCKPCRWDDQIFQSSPQVSQSPARCSRIRAPLQCERRLLDQPTTTPNLTVSQICALAAGTSGQSPQCVNSEPIVRA